MSNETRLNVTGEGTLALLLSRRSGSAKAMTGPGPNEEQIRTLIAAATRVPDHGKLAPWRFVILAGEARREFGEVLVTALKAAGGEPDAERLEQERSRFLRAPMVIGVVSKVREGLAIPEWEQMLSAGAACQTLCLAAHAMGFVANWITEWCAYDPMVQEALGLHAGERMAGFIYIGQPAAPLAERPRPKFEAVARYWGA